MKGLLATAVAGLLANSAMAADGTINFSGELTSASCKVTGGAGTSVTGNKGNQIINVNLGKVPIDALGGTAGGGIAAGTAINLELDCGNTGGGLTTVMLRFDPKSGSGIDAKNFNLLKTTGSASGVGIGLYDDDGNLLNLSANESIDTPLVASGTTPVNYKASLSMRAGYVKSSAAAPTPGIANGTLPFTLTYK
ncbi:fimbrial protein [Pseudomonas sp. TCU-HL1]|uniref:fimbrial protein n=1 Tax=Pseudomonas sp. TCU-HL1 TaxID=1856685 RepID=UPI00083E3007|nr:fimbrial protein [Pseudomonas sp. TCU-HL1]AOE88135.1 fimbrial protein [Pseudomonas sp. TCU-HL1]